MRNIENDSIYVYDAMTSERPYRKAVDEETAAAEIIKNAGTQFEPALSKIFIEKVLGKRMLAE